MGEQFHDGEVEIVRRREYIGCLSTEVRAQCDVYTSKHSQRNNASVLGKSSFTIHRVPSVLRRAARRGKGAS